MLSPEQRKVVDEAIEQSRKSTESSARALLRFANEWDLVKRSIEQTSIPAPRLIEAHVRAISMVRRSAQAVLNIHDVYMDTMIEIEKNGLDRSST